MKTALFVGLECPNNQDQKNIIHYPLIKIVPKRGDAPEIELAMKHFPSYTHLIFTSKNGVTLFFEFAKKHRLSTEQINNKVVISVGKKTTEKLQNFGIQKVITAAEETAEGVIQELEKLDLTKAHLFWPHSARSRDVLEQWMRRQQIDYTATAFYDTVTQRPEEQLDFSAIDEIIFTSPSTVDAFVDVFGSLPADKILSCIGPITEKHLAQKLSYTHRE